MKTFFNLSALKIEFENRSNREKILIFLIGIALLYAFFYFILFRQVVNQKNVLLEEINNIQKQIDIWKNQIIILQKISQTEIYKKWLSHRQQLESTQGQYKFFLHPSPAQGLQEVINKVLRAPSNITVVQIKNLPESLYTQTSDTKTAGKIYQLPFLIITYGNFFDTLNYIKSLEADLPNLHWNHLTYQVMQYPIAKVEMEFSILYEKENTPS